MALAAAAIGQIMNLSRSLLTPLLLMAFRDLEALAIPLKSSLLCSFPRYSRVCDGMWNPSIHILHCMK
jgi:hypothetical protein